MNAIIFPDIPFFLTTGQRKGSIPMDGILPYGKLENLFLQRRIEPPGIVILVISIADIYVYAYLERVLFCCSKHVVWTVRIPNWNRILAQLAIHFGDRVGKYP